MNYKGALSRYLALLALIIFYSCGTGMKVRKENFILIDRNFSACYNNEAYLIEGNNFPDSTTVSNLFELYDLNPDSVIIHFDSNNNLIVSLAQGANSTHITYKGKFSRRGYYEIFLRKDIKEIPPLIPIIYSHTDIYRLRLGLNANNDLIIDNKWRRTGTILIFAGGRGGRSQCYFKR